MIHLTSIRCGRKPVSRCLRLVLCTVLFGMMLPVLHAADDPYLQLLDEEVAKVGQVSTDTVEDGAVSSVEAGGTGSAQPAPSRKHFEALLRKQHVGTYSFYRRLPERSREEIFDDYSGGASMGALREKVIDRYLHP